MKKIIALSLIALSCHKEPVEPPKTEIKCYSCTVRVPGLNGSFDTCMVDITKLDMRNENGIGLPWECREKR